MKRFGFLLLLFCSPFSLGFGNEEAAESASLFEQSTHSPLFVSLGSNCTTAGMFRHFGMRNIAFPFDWIVSLDNEQFVELLNEDFNDFLNPDFLIMHPLRYGPLVHSHYHVEFSHDWDASYWMNKELIQEGQDRLNSKFKKRISRFKDLNKYKGTVVFVRLVFDSVVYREERPDLYWYKEDQLYSDHEISLKLYDALKKLFPRLDFSLVMIRKSEIPSIHNLSENIVEYNFLDAELHENWKKVLDQQVEKHRK